MSAVVYYAGKEGLKELYRRAKALSDEVAGDLGDVVALIPEGASTENKLATADDISAIEAVIPEGAAADNQLVTESKLETELSKLGGFVVALPDSHGYPDVSTPNPKMIYLVLDSSAPQPDQYKEWIWVLTETPDVYAWKCIGDTSVDLSGYYTKDETNGLLGGKADKVSGGTENHFASLTSTGNLADSGYSSGSFKAKASQSRTFTNDSATKTVDTVTEDVDGDISVTFKEIQTASTSVAGLVQLEDSYSSTSTAKAATPNSVKAAYDLAAGKYSLPSGGIPSTDLTSAVQASLGKADSAIQHVYAGQEELVPVSQTVTIPYAEAEQPVHEVTIGGRTYHTVTMPDGKEWLAENLDYQFCEIGGSGNPAEAHAWYYNNDQPTYGASGRNCGLLYNGYAALYLEEHKDTLLPAGWRVPTSADIEAMFDSISDKPGRQLKMPVSWAPYWDGNNVTGFGIIPCGYFYNGNFNGDTSSCTLTSSTVVGLERYTYYFSGSSSTIERQMSGLTTTAIVRLVNNTPVSPLPTYRGGLMTSGMTEKLEGIEAHAEVNVQADWNVSDSASDAFINNKPSLATVATSGSYTDLSNKPNLDNYAEKSTTVTSVTWDSSTSKLSQTINGTSTEIVDLSGMETVTNKVTSVRDTSTATDTAYPSEKAVATALAGFSGCTVTYTAGTGELHLDFSPQVNNGGN